MRHAAARGADRDVGILAGVVRGLGVAPLAFAPRRYRDVVLLGSEGAEASGDELDVVRGSRSAGVCLRGDCAAGTLAKRELDIVVVGMVGRAEIELDGLDVSGRHERGLDQQELVDRPAFDRIVNDLDLALRSERKPAPDEQQG